MKPHKALWIYIHNINNTCGKNLGSLKHDYLKVTAGVKCNTNTQLKGKMKDWIADSM
ncbi:hypothetical protein PAMP_022972 [Pampus punctatissimus]